LASDCFDEPIGGHPPDVAKRPGKCPLRLREELPIRAAVQLSLRLRDAQ
jgi:hypothetical protein